MYPPLDCLKEVADGIWIVDSGPLHLLGLSLPVRMTVVRLKSGDLWLHSRTRLTPSLQAAIDDLGVVAHIVAPNSAHWMNVRQWQQSYPRAITWAAPHLPSRSTVRNTGTVFNHQLDASVPDGWSADLTQVIVPGGFHYREAVFFHLASQTLVFTDLIVNLEAERLTPATRAFARLTGALSPHGKAPLYLRMIVNMRRREAAAAIERMQALNPQRVIFSHGRWYDEKVMPQLRASLSWLTT